ncbi:MAG: substrate-binding domain-containing protein, partial [bacterium]
MTGYRALVTAGMAVIVAIGVTSCNGSKESAADASGKTPAKKKLVVGYSQIGAESAWRTANTMSIKTEAEKRGVDLRFSDAQQKQENQIKALRTFLAQKVDVIMFSPVVETGWEPVLREIKA